MNRQKGLRVLLAGMSVVSLGIAGCNSQRAFEAQTPTATATPEATTPSTALPDSNTQAVDRDVPFVPTPETVVAEMLRLANVNQNDVIYDLGSGDGRIVIEAAQEYGAQGVGIDIDPALVARATENARQAGVSDRAQFIQQDLFETDLSDATVVTLYLLPEVNLRLRPKLLEELEPGTRIVSHAFDMGDWEPEQVVEVDGRTVYYWVVPEEVPAELSS